MQCNATREGIIQNLQCDARLDKRRCFGISLDKRNIAPVQSRLIGGDSDWCVIAAQVSALKDIDGLYMSYRRTSFQGSRISALRLEPTLSNYIRGRILGKVEHQTTRNLQRGSEASSAIPSFGCSRDHYGKVAVKG